MSFGRKGMTGAPAMAAPRPGFGTAERAPKATVDGAAMAERRAAFLAAEHARQAEQPSYPEAGTGRLPANATPVYVREKSMGMAYLLWFVIGGISAHRFYLGYTASGAVQLTLLLLSYGLLIGMSPIGFFLLIGAWLWILGDAFVIPSMTREANERIRQAAVGAVFT